MERRKFLAMLSAGAAGTFLPWQGAQAGNVRLRGYLRTNWSRDPYALGSYSYVAKGARQHDRLILGKAIDNKVYFAGEAVHATQNSTVHAAYESGRTTAKHVGRDSAGRVAIIGAGISGLAAAQALFKKGRSVTVFEARNRIGGRIWTSNALGMPLDLGASWIHGTRQNPVAKLARRAGLKTTPTDNSEMVRSAQGHEIADKDVPNWVENVTEIQHEAGADRGQINMQAFMAEDEYGGSEVIFPGGYDKILPTLAGGYQVRMSQNVSAISHDQKGVTIVSNGVKTRFDVVIVTLPLGVLKRNSVTFTPPLPAAKRSAISRLGMGTLDKLYLHYDRPFWDKDVTWITTPETGLPRGHFNQWLNLYKYLKQPVIMAFNGGPPALQLSRLSDKTLVNQAQKVLQNAYF